MIRTAEWTNWAINFVQEAIVVASLDFPCGPQGPCDGFVGSPERKRYQSMVHEWMTNGALPKEAVRRCACGMHAVYHPLIGLEVVDLCARCYGNEFPERAATFDLARIAPSAGEFHE